MGKSHNIRGNTNLIHILQHFQPYPQGRTGWPFLDIYQPCINYLHFRYHLPYDNQYLHHNMSEYQPPLRFTSGRWRSGTRYSCSKSQNSTSRDWQSADCYRSCTTNRPATHESYCPRNQDPGDSHRGSCCNSLHHKNQLPTPRHCLPCRIDHNRLEKNSSPLWYPHHSYEIARHLLHLVYRKDFHTPRGNSFLPARPEPLSPIPLLLAIVSLPTHNKPSPHTSSLQLSGDPYIPLSAPTPLHYS